MTTFSVPIIIEEHAAVERLSEPVTAGIPFPRGILRASEAVSLTASNGNRVPVQTQPLAHWPDGSIKWLLLDFQASMAAGERTELHLRSAPPADTRKPAGISLDWQEQACSIVTGAAVFRLGSHLFRPFEQVTVQGRDMLDPSGCTMTLTDGNGTAYQPRIENVLVETGGVLRTTLRCDGRFCSASGHAFANFQARLHFYAGHPFAKLDFTLHNPRAAKHPGGLWDLGDPGSVFFDDLAFSLRLRNLETPQIQWVSEPGGEDRAGDHDLIIYQDSSGGTNWRSSNHVNRKGEVRHSFQGYRVLSHNEVIAEGLRANPVVSLSDARNQVAATVQHFWQNFPKALEASADTLTVRLFPRQYNDLFELQGGEQKTHTAFLDFGPGKSPRQLRWAQNPLLVHATPEWYAASGAVPDLLPQADASNETMVDLIKTAIEGDNTFFDHREIIDEYGWRNFGEFYADHEAVFHDGPEPLVSHYNNQYDGIYGCLRQFLCSGKKDWFLLADQLCVHVKDIDIYHTDEDRPEYNHGLFWHTEHYIDAATATHRCFSRKHLDQKKKAHYGGGPSLSHVYATGLLLHYYLTGSVSSKHAVEELTAFVQNNIDAEASFVRQVKNKAKKVKAALEQRVKGAGLVQLNKVYGLDGPGRASGNALSTLLDAFQLTSDSQYLERAEHLIRKCIHPQDDIEARNLLDIENRWMYTVFLQALCKYLDVKSEVEQYDSMFIYARDSLLHYADWMAANEKPYLSQPEKLEYPNETWAAQELRKGKILSFAARVVSAEGRRAYRERSEYFVREACNVLQIQSRTLTRPLTLVMQSGPIADEMVSSSDRTLNPEGAVNTLAGPLAPETN